MLEAAPNLIVTADRAGATLGWARLSDGTIRFRCALGKSGLALHKREGDGATPIGEFALRSVLYRADREPPPETALPLRAIDRHDGWGDQPDAPSYNRMVRLPHPHRHEILWREDHVYDLIVVIGHNDAPPIPGHGSAIFLHLAREGYAPTEGCIAFARDDLLAILTALTPESRVVVRAEKLSSRP